MKRRLDGEYGEAGTGSPAASENATACNGLSRIAPAPVPAAQAVNVARSAKSPTPHEPAERSAYNWIIQPHVAGKVGRALVAAEPRRAGGGGAEGSASSSRSTLAITSGSTATCTPCQFSYVVATPYAPASSSRLVTART